MKPLKILGNDIMIVKYYAKSLEINNDSILENNTSLSKVQKIKRHQEADFRQSSGLIVPSVPIS